VTSRSWHSAFIRRELRAGRGQLGLFLICVFLSAVSLCVVSGWRSSVETAMASETRKSIGGDIVVSSREPFSEQLQLALEDFDSYLTLEMFSVVLRPSNQKTLFTKLKVVERPYPFYGEVPLRSGRDLHQALEEGLVVEERVLERLEMQLGESLKVGNQVFKVVDVALSEPDRPMGIWGVSPRVFLSSSQLDATGLLRPDSYLQRRVHIKLGDPSRAGVVAEELRQLTLLDQERIETWEEPPRRMERYVNNFFTYLDMMVVLALGLGGLGMQSTLSAWLRSRADTIAVARTLGAETGFVIRHYGAIVTLVSVVGFTLGLSFAAGFMAVTGSYLSSLLPIQVTPSLTLLSCLKAGFLCLLVSASFAAWPLHEAGKVKPAAVLRRARTKSSGKARLQFGTIMTLGLFLLLVAMIGELTRAAWISLILLGVLGVTYCTSSGLVRFCKTRKPDWLAFRVAVGSWRAPEARTELVIFTLSTCLALLYTVILCEGALRRSWVDAVPENTPNLLFLDIQPDQLEPFAELVGYPLEKYESLRVRALEVNGEPLDRSGERKRGDGRGRLDAQPALELPPNDQFVQGDSLFLTDAPDQVSVRQDVAEELNLSVGDRMKFYIQGIAVEATVSSIRFSRREEFRPRFELIFPPSLVEGAPRRVFATARIPEREVGALQTEIAQAFPGIVSIDLSYTIRIVAERLDQMVGLMNYFLGCGMMAGVLILVSSTWSSRARRTREIAYYKVMGAGRSFLRQVLLAESLLLGACTATLAMGLATGFSWYLCRWELDIPLAVMPWTLTLMLVVPAGAISLLSWALGQRVLMVRPAPYLREE
jgi:putative ABC transport system permease protein